MELRRTNCRALVTEKRAAMESTAPDGKDEPMLALMPMTIPMTTTSLFLLCRMGVSLSPGSTMANTYS